VGHPLAKNHRRSRRPPRRRQWHLPYLRWQRRPPWNCRRHSYCRRHARHPRCRDFQRRPTDFQRRPTDFRRSQGFRQRECPRPRHQRHCSCRPPQCPPSYWSRKQVDTSQARTVPRALHSTALFYSCWFTKWQRGERHARGRAESLISRLWHIRPLELAPKVLHSTHHFTIEMRLECVDGLDQSTRPTGHVCQWPVGEYEPDASSEVAFAQRSVHGWALERSERAGARPRLDRRSTKDGLAICILEDCAAHGTTQTRRRTQRS